MKIFATRRIPDAGFEILKRIGDVELAVAADDEMVPREQLLEKIKSADVLVSLLTERIDREALEAGARLLGVANYAVGFNNVDVTAATELGLPVTNTPGVLTDTTADLAWALILAVARNIVPADRYMRQGRYKIWGPSLFLGGDVSPGGEARRKVLGIVGFGRIGQAVFRRSTGFDMRALAYDPPMREVIEKTDGVEYAEMDRILEESDFISIHTDLNPSTHHLISGAGLREDEGHCLPHQHRPGAHRRRESAGFGSPRRKIAGAGLDVFEDEPAMAPGLAELDNVVVLPHIASASRDTRNKMATMCAENAAAHSRRERAPNCVNPEVYESEAYRRRVRI